MVIDKNHAPVPNALLGLSRPAEPASRPSAGRRTAAALTDQKLPARPNYQIVSSGRDSEDDEPRGGTSDTATALGAGVVLVIFLAAIGLLLN